jgi:16S rRNA C1402 N4-methylase RsmH
MVRCVLVVAWVVCISLRGLFVCVCVCVGGGGGGGGEPRARGAAVVAVDRDPAACALAEGLAADPTTGGRLTVVPGCFSALGRLLPDAARVDAVVFDAGLCSTQVRGQPSSPYTHAHI